MTITHLQSKSKHLLTIINLFLLSLDYSLADTNTYRWQANDGTVLYSDILPPEESNKQRIIIDTNGMTIKIIERAKTQKEQSAERAKKKLEVERNRQIALQNKKDRNLIHSYRHEQDLIQAKNSKLKSIEQSIDIKRDSLTLLHSNLEKLRHSAAEYERATRPIPTQLHKNINIIRDNIKSDQLAIKTKKKQQLKISARYQQLLQRYRKLKHPSTP